MSYWVICDRCGFQYKNDELKKEWTGLMVCAPCFEHRHPQEMIRPIPDQFPLPYSRPEKYDFSQEIAINCDTATFRFYPSVFAVDTTIIKGSVQGPMIVEDVTVTVQCTLEIY